MSTNQIYQYIYSYTHTHTHTHTRTHKVVKNLSANARNTGLIPELRRSSGEGKGYPLQYSSLENFMDRTAWQAAVLGVTKSRT